MLLSFALVLLMLGLAVWRLVARKSQPGPTTSGTMMALQWMNAARFRQTSTLLPHGKVLIAGGENNGRSLAGAEIYDPFLQRFDWASPMQQPRAGHAAVLLMDGRVLITGGYEGNTQKVTASAEIFDPGTRQFSPTAPMSTPRWGHTATLLSTGRVLVAGGNDGRQALASAETFDPSTGKFTPAQGMSVARTLHTASVLPSGLVLIAGGSDGNAGLKSAEFFDPVTGAFSRTADMSQARASQSAVVLGRGEVLVLGGSDGQVSLDTAEIFDPASKRFTETGRMPRAVSSQSAVVLNSGEALLVGGRRLRRGDGPNIWAATALYEPDTRTFVPGPLLPRPEYSGAATLLSDGTVLITGGNDGTGAIATAAIYRPRQVAAEVRGRPARRSVRGTFTN